MNVRVSATGSIARPQLRIVEKGELDSSGARKDCRQVYFSETKETLPCEVYDRYQLKCGNRIAGPAIVEEIDSTVLIHPGGHADVDRFGNLVIETGAEA